MPRTNPTPYKTLHDSTSTLSLSSHHHHSHHLDQHLDLEHDADSDTTLASEGFLSKRSYLASRSSKVEAILTWFRWGTVLFFQGVIIMMLLPTSGLMSDRWGFGFGRGERAVVVKAGVVPIDTRTGSGWSPGKTETGGDVNGLYIPLSHKYTLLTPEESRFVPNMSTNSSRMEIRRNWDMLMPLGSGSVAIPDYTEHPMLGKPIIDDPIRSGPLFEASWTHALHCLYYTVDTYHQLVLSNGTRFGFEGTRNDYHAAHCFEYLRNQILCMADMTLEGRESVLDATGAGQAHMCRNREEAIQWIEERRVDDIRSIVGP